MIDYLIVRVLKTGGAGWTLFGLQVPAQWRRWRETPKATRWVTRVTDDGGDGERSKHAIKSYSKYGRPCEIYNWSPCVDSFVVVAAATAVSHPAMDRRWQPGDDLHPNWNTRNHALSDTSNRRRRRRWRKKHAVSRSELYKAVFD